MLTERSSARGVARAHDGGRVIQRHYFGIFRVSSPRCECWSWRAENFTAIRTMLDKTRR